jgi:hypothetical protein
VNAVAQGISLPKLPVPGPAFDCRLVLVDNDLPGVTKVADLHGCQIEICGNGFAAREPCYLLQHAFALIPGAGRLDSRNLQRAAYLVHHQSGQRFPLNVLRDYDQRFASPGDLFQQWEQLLLGTDFLFVNQHT